MNRIRAFFSGLALNIIGSVVALLMLLSLISGSIGFASFTESFKNEYAVSTYHMADTAATLVNGDSIERYLIEGEDEEFLRTAGYLDTYCHKMSVSLIYVIAVDTTDYGRFVSVFNSVDNSVDNSAYTPWELGYQRDTTNDEYREKYKALYGGTSAYETVYRTTNLKGYHPHITTMVPVKDSEGTVTALLCIQRPMSELDKAAQPYLLNIVLSTVGIVVIAAVLYAFFLNRHFVVPIKNVSDEATRFARENRLGEKLGQVSKISEIANLAHSIDTMETDMLLYIENLTALNAEKERADAEMSIATTIQVNSVPNEFPVFPDRTDFSVYGSMTSAKEVGGDFYNFLLIDEDHLMLVIGDVSGKGVPAALFMMVTNILISDRTLMGGTPGEILSYVNDRLCEHNTAEMFVTIWLGILDLKTGKLTIANAGHDDAAVCREGGRFELHKTRHGLVAGAMPGIQYKDFELQLGKGDKLFLYTDGVPEATDANNQLFAMGRTLDALNECREETPEKILEGVKARVDAFVGEAPQFDDLTMLCLHYKGKETEADGDVEAITVPAVIENIEPVTDLINEKLAAIGCPVREQTQIDVAVDEILSNIARYAYEGEAGEMSVRVKPTDSPRGVELTFTDSGVPFDPLRKPDPDVTLPAEQRGIGGLGIFLVRKTMDEVLYRYEEGRNILVVRKYF